MNSDKSFMGGRGGGGVVKLCQFLFFILASPNSWREGIKIGAVIGNLFEGFSFCLRTVISWNTERRAGRREGGGS